ncbi:MAG: PIG-L family deacetylase [Candidatus Lokiarchaeota archaeon]|nr:PIG-L family deacetylase [Candidatus Lokiarchaeota archaeon]
MARLLIICPHPDDAEATCAGTCQEAVRLGWDVHELLMTSDEYGTPRNEFKGMRIKRIRVAEMTAAAKEYGTNPDGSPKIHLHWFGEIDGYLPFDRGVLGRLVGFIKELRPRIVLAPDSFFTLDYHVDHMRTGWLAYIAVKAFPTVGRPLLLLYHSTAPDFYVPFPSLDIQTRAWQRHRSQSTPLRNELFRKLRPLYYILRWRKTGMCFSDGFRRATFEPGENELEGFLQRAWWYFFARATRGYPREYYLPSPEALGLRHE